VNASVTLNKKPQSVDELVAFVARSAREHYQKTGKGLEGSTLAYMVRLEYPELDYAELGLHRLGDLVREAVAQKQIVRNKDVRHLEVLPAPFVLLPTSATPDGPPEKEPIQKGQWSVKPEIWRAVVLWSPNSVAFLNRTNGTVTEVSSGDSARLQNMRKNPTFAEIERVEQNAQIEWLMDFLNERKISTDGSHDRLLSILRGEIKTFGLQVAHDWRSLRSRKIVEIVRAWAIENGVDEETALVPLIKERKKSSSATESPTIGSEEKVRAAIVSAIQEMPLSELENVSLPLRYVLRHFVAK
jgi:hypothetical protein